MREVKLRGQVRNSCPRNRASLRADRSGQAISAPLDSQVPARQLQAFGNARDDVQTLLEGARGDLFRRLTRFAQILGTVLDCIPSNRI